MKIKEILRQHRRDFRAVYECEGCGEVHTGPNGQGSRGYDDRNFHDNVIPNLKCDVCGKSRNDLGIISEPTPTKYPEGFQV